MIGMVLVTHGRLAVELINALEHVVGPLQAAAPVCIAPEDDVEERRAEILRCIKDVDTGAGVILLTDMFGGTPSNLAISIIEDRNVEVIAGVNLPMLVKLASVRADLTIESAVRAAIDAGRKYITAPAKMLNQAAS